MLLGATWCGKGDDMKKTHTHNKNQIIVALGPAINMMFNITMMLVNNTLGFIFVKPWPQARLC